MLAKVFLAYFEHTVDLTSVTPEFGVLHSVVEDACLFHVKSRVFDMVRSLARFYHLLCYCLFDAGLQNLVCLFLKCFTDHCKSVCRGLPQSRVCDATLTNGIIFIILIITLLFTISIYLGPTVTRAL